MYNFSVPLYTIILDFDAEISSGCSPPRSILYERLLGAVLWWHEKEIRKITRILPTINGLMINGAHTPAIIIMNNVETYRTVVCLVYME